jgi:uridylate kinase
MEHVADKGNVFIKRKVEVVLIFGGGNYQRGKKSF